MAKKDKAKQHYIFRQEKKRKQEEKEYAEMERMYKKYGDYSMEEGFDKTIKDVLNG